MTIRRTALMWPPAPDVVTPPPEQRFWTLPIELLWRGRIDTNGLTDLSINFEVDLLSTWGGGVGWGQNSYAGTLLQNVGAVEPSMLIDTYGGAQGTDSPHHWQGESASYYPDALPSPHGRYFWVRNLIERDASSARAWFDGDAEPSSWQHVQFPLNSRYFEADQDFWLYVFLSANRYPVNLMLDSIAIVRGYGSTLTIDDFGRVVAGGWGTSDIGQAWNTEEPLHADMISVDGAQGRWDRTIDTQDTGQAVTLYLPNGATI